MSSSSPFDHRRDPELGAALQAALGADGEPAFVRRVTAAARMGAGRAGDVWWGVLGTWARPGVAAALALMAGATFWLVNASSRNELEISLEEVFLAAADAPAPSFLVTATAPPSFDLVLASSLEP